MIRTRAVSGARGAFLFLFPGVWIAAVLAVSLFIPGGEHVLSALAVAPALACAGTGRRQCVLISGMMALGSLALGPWGREGDATGARLGAGLAVCAVILACARIAGRRARVEAELERTREIAVAAQQVLLRPLPQWVNGFAVAGEYVSSTLGASVGGDLYEVLSTPYGLRAVLGDVRGHGLPAIATVAALLGSFREAAHDEPELAGVLHRLDRSFHRHVRERSQSEHPSVAETEPQAPVGEEFVTVLLLQIGDDGLVQIVNCGHPQPYVIGERPEPLPLGDPLPPLGLFDPAGQPTPVHRDMLLPGQALVLYTDGIPDARDASGKFFPLANALANALATASGGAPGGTPRGADALCAAPLIASALRAALLRHTGGRITDDMALLVLLRDTPRVPALNRRAVLSGVPRH